jgi:GNAT superfamily N-acetyltransferase
MPAGFEAVMALEAGHKLHIFESGSHPLDHWLRTWAQHSQRTGNSARTFVICPEEDGRRVVGYYALAASSAARSDLPRKLRSGVPQEVPVVLLARLAVDRRYQGRRLGAALLKDALARVAGVADVVGAVALAVHAKDDDACNFYRHFGFIPSPIEPAHLFLPVTTIREAVRAAAGSDMAVKA